MTIEAIPYSLWLAYALSCLVLGWYVGVTALRVLAARLRRWT